MKIKDYKKQLIKKLNKPFCRTLKNTQTKHGFGGFAIYHRLISGLEILC